MHAKRYDIRRLILRIALFATLAALLAAASGCDLVIPVLSPAATPTAADYQLKVFMLDVGQGDGILLASGGQYMLIDAGEPDKGDDVVADLQRLGVTKLEAVVGTHPHSDHIGGLPSVLGAFPVDAVYLPRKTAGTEVYENLLDAIGAAGLTVTAPKPGDKLTLGQAELTFLWPPADFESENENNHSIVIMASAGGRSVLLCGDIEKKAENGILDGFGDIGCDVLKVAHHGGDTSTTDDFLAAAHPKIALISVGLRNSYKHPDKDVLQRLKDAGVVIHRTDQNGMVTVTIRDGTIIVEDEKQ